MRFQTPLIEGRLLRRYKRFLADVELADGRQVTAHCPNPGAMTGLAEPGTPVWLQETDNPARKLRYGWKLAGLEGGHMACIDTGLSNRVVEEGLLSGAVPALAGFSALRREVRTGPKSRIDFLLDTPDGPPTWVEVKSVTLRRGDMALFPDAVTRRGARHLADLAERVAQGERAVLFYLVNRTDCRRVGVAADIDPAYAEALQTAREAGVRIVCHGTRITPRELSVGPSLPFADRG